MKAPVSSKIRWFDSLRLEDLDIVGGKNASLGELFHSVRKEGVRVPRGFALTVGAFQEFMKSNRITGLVQDLLSDQNKIEDPVKAALIGERVRAAVLAGRFGEETRDAILSAYHELIDVRQGRLDVAVRSSATAEDLPEASFAGQQDTFLNVEGERDLLNSVRNCFASLYSDRAIMYRAERNISHTRVFLSVGVQEMVRSDLATSGVLFTLEPETGFRDLIVINSSYGLGESIVKGIVNPDEFWVYKPLLEDGFAPILKREPGTKERSLVYDPTLKQKTIEVDVPPERRSALSLTDAEVIELARAGIMIEHHFSKEKDRQTPMDIEWAKDGLSGELFVVQARPETVQSRKVPGGEARTIQYFIEEAGPVLARGKSVGAEIQTGTARVIYSVKDLHQLKDSEILVTTKTDPDWEPVLKRAAAVVTNRGGRTCHAAILARELGIPAIVGTGNGTTTIRNGETITVSSAEGDVGFVYRGTARFRTEEIPVLAPGALRTQVMLNLGRPADAIRHSFLPISGVGLARMEFMISSSIGIHPMAIAHLDQVPNPDEREKILRMISPGEAPDRFFVRRLSEQIGVMAAAFYPKPVILRMSDFKSNEYAALAGGSAFEQPEENPMLGFRGSFRYWSNSYRDGFRLECEAVRKVRFEMGLVNVKVMIPFCRTIEDAKNSLAELGKAGLRRGEGGLEVWMMCEIPSNVILAREFLELFDGFSIGSNDLTQLVLGVDRDSERLAPLFRESDPSVKEMIRSVIRTARELDKPIGLCGQAPSDDPEFAEFLVGEGIHSLSLNPDSVLKILPIVERAERKRREEHGY